jgi:GTP-binding protein Era
MQKKCGIVVLMGETNAGKSTLINALVGQKVSIVSRKAQTTLEKTSGIAICGDSQIILVDTPGFTANSNRDLGELEKNIWNAFRESDEVLFLVDVSKNNHTTSVALLKKIDAAKKVSLVMNKIDLVHKPKLLEMASMFSDLRDFANVFMISSLLNNGVDNLMKYLAAALPYRDWIYDEDQITDTTFEKYVSEITREHIYNYLHQEIPYKCKVEVENYENQADGSIRIVQNIYVASPAHRKIVLGHNGQKIKAIGTAARQELSQLLERTVHLFLHVYEKPAGTVEKSQQSSTNPPSEP